MEAGNAHFFSTSSYVSWGKDEGACAKEPKRVMEISTIEDTYCQFTE